MPEFGMPEYVDTWMKIYKDENLEELGKELAPDLDLVAGTLTPAKPEVGLDEDLCMLMKLEKGVLTEVKYVKKEEAEKATLLVTMPYDQAKSLFSSAAGGKAPDLIPMVMSGKIKIKGDITKLMKYAGAMPKLMPIMLGLLGKVETIWPDEYPPDKLEDFKARLKKKRQELGV